MKIALLSCNIGFIDEIRPPAKQRHEYEFFYYTENNLPAPLPHLNNRMKGKYLKTQSHKFLDHDLFIWIDGSVEVTDGTFIDWVIQNMEGCDLMTTLHTTGNVYDELNGIIKGMRKGGKYLLSRYAREPFEQELQFYSGKLPHDYPLYQCWFFARWNNEFLNDSFDRWWDLILRYSNFDQSQFSFAAWEHGLNIKTVDSSKYLLRHKHL